MSASNLTRYDAARHALQAAASVDEAKEIHDQSEALRAYVENKYPTMALEEILALKVGDIAAPDAALFLWAALLEEGFEVLRAWGFQFRSHAVWVKPSVGMGQWFRQQHETLLLGVRGNIPVPLAANRSPSVIIAPRGKHSEKPDAAYEIIERGFPEFPKIELFARRARRGWKRWGLEAEPGERAAAE